MSNPPSGVSKIAVTAGDEVNIGMRSGGWPEFKRTLQARLDDLRSARITRPDIVAGIFNKTGFRTGSGRSWDARLIVVAKIILFGTATYSRNIHKPSAPVGESTVWRLGDEGGVPSRSCAPLPRGHKI